MYVLEVLGTKDWPLRGEVAGSESKGVTAVVSIFWWKDSRRWRYRGINTAGTTNSSMDQQQHCTTFCAR